MAYIDYYKVLELDKNATEADIKKAYRKLARKYHPDLNPNDKDTERKFKEINEANEVLSNQENRKKYDQYGTDWKHADSFENAQQSQQQGNRSSQQASSGSFSGNDYSDFFESIFGGGGSSQRGTGNKFRGQDYSAELTLGIKDVFTTHKRVLTVNGKNIRLTIPAGVKNGQVIQINGLGGEGINGGPKGDLIIQFNIKNNTPFSRDADNLHLTIDLDLYKALLGGEIVIDLFDGRAKLQIKPETVNGIKVKLKGKGFPVYKKEGEFGDLYITYNIKLPSNLTEKEKELFIELSKLRTL